MEHECEIDYCPLTGSKLLTVETASGGIKINLCRSHPESLRSKLSEIVGRERGDLLSGGLFGTIAQLNEAIDYLDALAAATFSVGH